MSLQSQIHHCPDCQTVVRLKTGRSNFVVCAGCGSLLRKSESNVLLSKPGYIAFQATDALRPGSTGKWEEKTIEILGRIRLYGTDIVSSIWSVRQEGGELMWLQSSGAVNSILESASPISNTVQIERLKKAKPGSFNEYFGKDKSKVISTEIIHKWELEGEAAFPLIDWQVLRILQLARTDEYFTVLMLDDSVFCFRQRFISLHSLQLRELREPGGKISVECSSCRRPFDRTVSAESLSFCCPHCEQPFYIDRNQQLAKAKKGKSVYLPALRPGMQGVIDGVNYEVKGFAFKKEKNEYHSYWKEYYLYHPLEGFVTLSEYGGHWILLRQRGDIPVLQNLQMTELQINGVKYELFNRYNFEVTYAGGECPGNIFDTSVKAREYIAPPSMWACEHNTETGEVWYYGVHVPRKTVQQAFPEAALPPKTGVGAVQPWHIPGGKPLMTAGIISVVLLILLHYLVNPNPQNRPLFQVFNNLKDTSNTFTYVTPRFQFDKASSNIHIDAEAMIDNTWVDLAVTLVNAKTGEERFLTKEMSYYSGIDGGEKWSEGNTHYDLYFTRVPRGEYFLQIELARDASSRSSRYVHVDFFYDTRISRNLIWSLILVALIHASLYGLHRWFESRRWSNSPFDE